MDPKTSEPTPADVKAKARFKVGQRVRIKTIGCDCPPKPASARCYRHDWVGEVGTIAEITVHEDGGFEYELEELPYEEFYDDELTGTRQEVSL